MIGNSVQRLATIGAYTRPAHVALAAAGALLLGAAIGIEPLGPAVLAAVVLAPIAVAVFLDARVAFVVICVVVAVSGPELRAGPAAAIDIAVAIALAGLIAQGNRASAVRPNVGARLLMAATAFAIVLALARGNELGAVGQDVHIFLLPVAMYFVVRQALALAGGGWIVGVLALVVVGASLKTLLLAGLVSGVSAGPSSPYQAWVVSESFGLRRVILVGGDSFVVLAPALCVFARHHRFLRGGRWIAALAIGGLAVGVTGTRTNIIMAVVALALALVLEQSTKRTSSRLKLLLGFGVGVALLGALVYTVPSGSDSIGAGVTNRFTDPVVVNTSASYRDKEQNRLLEAVSADPWLGLGAGSTYVTQVTPTEWGTTRWAHDGFLWMLLKGGILGLAIVGAAVLVISRRLWLNCRGASDPLAAVALVILITIFGLSISTNRFADPGAGLLLATVVAAAATTGRRQRAPVPSGPVRSRVAGGGQPA